MLSINNEVSNTARIIGIDPGSQMLGVAVLEFDIDSMEIVSTIAWTIKGTKLIEKDSWIEQIHGERIARIRALQKELLRIFNSYLPLFIASESPFYNQRRPQAYGALTEVICAVRNAVIEYDVWRKLHLIDPPTVKNAVGAPGNADKDKVKEKIALLTNLNYSGEVPLLLLDEHSIDALAVAYCQFKQMLEVLCLKVN